MESITILNRLKNNILDKNQAEVCVEMLLNENIVMEQKVAALSFIESRKPSIIELNTFANYILTECTVPFKYDEDLLDVCGTGGDGNNTLNISTLTAIILAATGIKVCKHGNYGVTSVNGSSGILEYLGYKFNSNGDRLKNELDSCNITFLHAPLFHPVLKNIASLRKNLKLRTIFNVLGPMVNPLQTKYRYTGVNSLHTARAYHFIYQQKPIEYTIVFTLDGNDEVSLTDTSKVYSNSGEKLIHPKELSSQPVLLSDLQVDSMEHAAKLFKDVLENKATRPVLEAVLANSAMAYSLRNPQADYSTAKAICEEVLINGKAKSIFNKLINFH
jgi:anthranilate phosphoribosyltransferase